MKQWFVFASFLFSFFAAFISVYLYNSKYNQNASEITLFQTSNYVDWFKSKYLNRSIVSSDILRYGNKNFNLESGFLYHEIPIVCLFLVRNEKNANAARDTWGKSCNEIVMLNLVEDKKKIIIKRDKSKLPWVLLCKALKGISDRFQWVLIIQDTTFVILENLRLFVAGLNYSNTYYLGHSVTFWNTFYNMGKAGIVLSKGTLDRIKINSVNCISNLTYWNREDYYLGKALKALNVTPLDTKDEFGFSTFHPYSLAQTLFSGGHQESVFPSKCCSMRAITFNAIEGDKMYSYYYILYILQLFSSGHLGNKPPKRLPKDEVWQKFLKERDIPFNISAERYYKIWEDLIDDPTSFAYNMKKEFHPVND